MKRWNCIALLILVAHFEINLLVWAFCGIPKEKHNCFIMILIRVLLVAVAAYYSNSYYEEFYVTLWEYWKESNSVSQFWWLFLPPEPKKQTNKIKLGNCIFFGSFQKFIIGLLVMSFEILDASQGTVESLTNIHVKYLKG